MLLFTTDMIEHGRRPCDVRGSLRRCATVISTHGLETTIVTHTEFGGATSSAAHVVGVVGVNAAVIVPSSALPRCLAHIISPTANTYSQEIDPLPMVADPPRSPIFLKIDVLHPAGLWDITKPILHVGCGSVFKRLSWVCHHLTSQEFLRAYNMPLGMDAVLSVDRHARNVLVRGISPLIVASIFQSI